MVGFAKSALDNIADDELSELKAQARAFFALSPDQIEALMAMDELTEVNCGGED